jgi:hypothetical protein
LVILRLVILDTPLLNMKTSAQDALTLAAHTAKRPRVNYGAIWAPPAAWRCLKPAFTSRHAGGLERQRPSGLQRDPRAAKFNRAGQQCSAGPQRNLAILIGLGLEPRRRSVVNREP